MLLTILTNLIMIIWIVDICNVGVNINGFNLVEFLDITLPLNTFFWFLLFLFYDPKSK